jgi:small nuclear ribonucleoprotein E
MAGKARVQKTIVVPINMVFRFLQTKARVQIWLYEQANMRIEGQLCGFDEYMNIVLEDAEEVCFFKN